MKRIPFTKMEGLGNDYVFVDCLRTPLPAAQAPALARSWSSRHFGIGADGLILLLPDAAEPVRMAMWNADGSRAAMCGNGLRCLARLAFDHGHATSRRFQIATDSGPHPVELLDDGLVRAGLGQVRCAEPRHFVVAGRPLQLVVGEAGNPHAVCFVADVDTADVHGLGTALQHHPLFPGGVNVEFVAPVGPTSVRQRTFERGSGETLACGTGAAVAVVAARAAGHLQGEVATVLLRGGELRVRGHGSSLAIEGPARTVFVGEIELPE